MKGETRFRFLQCSNLPFSRGERETPRSRGERKTPRVRGSRISLGPFPHNDVISFELSSFLLLLGGARHLHSSCRYPPPPRAPKVNSLQLRCCERSRSARARANSVFFGGKIIDLLRCQLIHPHAATPSSSSSSSAIFLLLMLPWTEQLTVIIIIFVWHSIHAVHPHAHAPRGSSARVRSTPAAIKPSRSSTETG